MSVHPIVIVIVIMSHFLLGKKKRAFVAMALHNVVPHFFSKSGTLIIAYFRYNCMRRPIAITAIMPS